MKKFTWLIGVASVACGASGPEFQEFDGEVAYTYVQQQVAFGPRVPNTNGHVTAGDWIRGRLEATADSVETQEWVHVTLDGDSLRMRNFIARFRPEIQGRILYVAHWDTRPMADRSQNIGQQMMPVPGANDGGSGVAVLLGVADALKALPSNFGVDLVFVDGEDYGVFAEEADVLIGSKYFAENLPEDYAPLFGVVFDMVGDSDQRFLKEGYSVNGAPEVVTRVWTRADDIGYGRIFRNTIGGAITDDHVPLLDAGLRVIDVIDLDYEHWHTTDDTVDKVSAESLQVVGDVAMALLR
jgi:glutaminyl-peptide cyclotransferase